MLSTNETVTKKRKNSNVRFGEDLKDTEDRKDPKEGDREQTNGKVIKLDGDQSSAEVNKARIKMKKTV